MKMYMYYNRALPGAKKEDTSSSIVEVECVRVTQLEDVSVGWLPAGEFKVRIIKPEFMYEPREVRKETEPGVFVKEKIMEQPVYFGHFLFDTIEEARDSAYQLVRNSFEFQVRKNKISSYTEEEVAEAIAKIKEVLLP